MTDDSGGKSEDREHRIWFLEIFDFNFDKLAKV
jgi:hypothetical protein